MNAQAARVKVSATVDRSSAGPAATGATVADLSQVPGQRIDRCGLGRSTTLSVTSGVTYRITVDGLHGTTDADGNAAVGDIRLAIRPAIRPENDDLERAIPRVRCRGRPRNAGRIVMRPAASRLGFGSGTHRRVRQRPVWRPVGGALRHLPRTSSGDYRNRQNRRRESGHPAFNNGS